ncbi:MAG: nucleoside triphosphate pyrophosphohydrolase [Myxococcota bacterium]|nr:nucleoside triphosphate pyrophosphohydrolase [Myxococcota bacterium]
MRDVRDLERLVSIMARLRDPEGGCPWDLEQDFASIAPYTVEEAYEVDDAIRRGDLAELCEELGDLLLQVVYHARMAEEAGHFDLGDVARAICDKLVRRHPHVFGDARVGDAEAQTRSWEALKAEERRARRRHGVLDDVPLALPALARAQKLQRRAARAGLAPSREAPAPATSGPTDPVALGDRLFALADAARRAGLDAEAALRDANARFEARVRAGEPEARVRAGRSEARVRPDGPGPAGSGEPTS